MRQGCIHEEMPNQIPLCKTRDTEDQRVIPRIMPTYYPSRLINQDSLFVILFDHPASSAKDGIECPRTLSLAFFYPGSQLVVTVYR